MQKHAYLIIAHEDFEMLKLLLEALDDVRNDIYLHFDGKLKEWPSFTLKNADLYIIEKSVNVYWGNVSQIEAEYKLYETAYSNGSYIYYHLLSGVDYPLQNQDYIHDFFYSNKGKEFISFSPFSLIKEIDRKVRRYHIFSKNFRYPKLYKRLCRYLFLKLQEIVGWKRNRKVNFKKGANWCSMTEDFILHLLEAKDSVLKMYKNSFCADEIYKQTLCWNSPFRERIFNLECEARGGMRAIKWRNNLVLDWQLEDYDELVNSKLIFARKFSSNSIDIVIKLNRLIHQTHE